MIEVAAYRGWPFARAGGVRTDSAFHSAGRPAGSDRRASLIATRHRIASLRPTVQDTAPAADERGDMIDTVEQCLEVFVGRLAVLGAGALGTGWDGAEDAEPILARHREGRENPSTTGKPVQIAVRQPQSSSASVSEGRTWRRLQAIERPPPRRIPAIRITRDMPGHGHTGLLDTEPVGFASFAALTADPVVSLEHDGASADAIRCSGSSAFTRRPVVAAAERSLEN
jgi:hypothetical protein